MPSHLLHLNSLSSNTLILLLITLITPILTTNIDNGQSNTILSGELNTIFSGNQNVVDGSGNGIDGSLNSVKGDDNFVKGDQNLVKGEDNNIKGNGNIVQGVGNVIVTSEEEFFKALRARNITNMFEDKVIGVVKNIKESSPQITPTSTQNTPSSLIPIQPQPQPSPQLPSEQIIITQPLSTPQPTSTKIPEILSKQQTQQILPPTSPPQQQPPLPPLPIQQYPNLVQVTQATQISSSPAQIPTNQIDQNSNYSIKQPVKVKEVTITQISKQSSLSFQELNNQTSDYGVKQPVQVKEDTGVNMSTVIKENNSNDIVFFNSDNSTENLTQVQEVKTVSKSKPIQQEINPTTQETQRIQQPNQPQPILNLRAHFNRNIQTDLNQSQQYPQPNQIQNQSDKIIHKVKFTQINYLKQEATRSYFTQQSITKNEYISLVWTQHS